MNRTRMMIEDAAFSVLELGTIALCIRCIWVWWGLTP